MYVVTVKDSSVKFATTEKGIESISPRVARDLITKLAKTLAYLTEKKTEPNEKLRKILVEITKAVLLMVMAGKNSASIIKTVEDLTGGKAEATFIFNDLELATLASDCPYSNIIDAALIAFTHLSLNLYGDIDSIFFHADVEKILLS